MKSYTPQLIASTAVSAAVNVMSYVIVTYLPLYAKQTLGISEADAFFVLFVAVLLRMALIPIFGLLSDRMGRRKMLAVSMGVFSVTINPTT